MYKLYPLVLIVVFVSCKNSPEKLSPENRKELKESLVEVNRVLVKKDSDKILGYVRRHNWDMKETKSGLWYEILKEGDGDSVKTGMTIAIEYTVSLLNGTVCYTSEELGPKTFEVGKGGVESGLEEGVLLLRQGAKARFIMPPHLAHGLIGDENKIPARAIIIYELELIQLQ